MVTLLGNTRGTRGGSSGGTPVADSPDAAQSLNASSISVSQTAQPLQQQLASQIKTTPICSFQESVSPQATLIYRELYVLPFQYYDKLRKVCLFCLSLFLVLHFLIRLLELGVNKSRWFNHNSAGLVRWSGIELGSPV